MASTWDQALSDHIGWLLAQGLPPAANVHVHLRTGAPMLRPAFAYVIAAGGYRRRFRLRIFKADHWWYAVHDMAKPEGQRVVGSGWTPCWETTRDVGLYERERWAWGGQ